MASLNFFIRYDQIIKRICLKHHLHIQTVKVWIAQKMSIFLKKYRKTVIHFYYQKAMMINTAFNEVYTQRWIKKISKCFLFKLKINFLFYLNVKDQFSNRSIPMMKSSCTILGEAVDDLLRCCNKSKHLQMLIHEDDQLMPEMEKNQSKQGTTDSCNTSQHDIFSTMVKKQTRHKVSLSERRNSMNLESYSKKQGERPSLFQHEIAYKMNTQAINRDTPSQKKEIIQDIYLDGSLQSKKHKTSLRQNKPLCPNRPYLIPFSLIDDLKDNHAKPNQTHKISIKRISKKNQPPKILNLKQNNSKNSKNLNLKLGSNLPTYRSEFYNTNETNTSRSQVLP